MNSVFRSQPALLRLLLAAVAVLAFAVLPVPAHATVDDSHSFAMEAAIPFVNEGFIVREDFWNGEVKSGQQLMVRHQLFKGNDYAFWVGTANDDCTIDVKVLDDKGNPIHITPKMGIGPNFTSVRVNPPKTGTYSIVFSVTSKAEKSVFWALAYGYR
ncbi:MAG: hypothetical protein JWO89_1349 [Verrucomicrobiaceae bacterium]|nr:hypothetical protein [Verrucomicrobiaceae bacterium]MDB6116709.1 hypothetical protein [Verrucomicrobiaceae bacterium]